jgi:uncharacterized damage-inducible protein DinB
MTPKEILLEQFNAAYDQNGWFVALKNTLVNLTAEQAAWQPENAENPIWGILAHLNYYNRAYVERFKGVDYVYSKNTNDETFASDEALSEEAWKLEIAEFEIIMNEWREQLESADQEKFNQPYKSNHKSVWASVITHINLHNAHHGGQIVLLRKLQGSWDSSKGVS